MTALVLLLGAGAASANPPLVVADRITDRVGALASDAPATARALEELGASGVELYVVFVDSFDTTADQDWAEQTARQSALEDSDMLLAVAVGTETYEYGWWLGDSFPVSAVDVEEMVTGDVEPAMDTGDWAGGVAALAEELRSGTSPAADADTEGSEAPLWTGRTTVTIVGTLFAVLLVAHLLSRRGSVTASSQ